MKYLVLTVLTIGFVPFLSSAATYHYVNTQGLTSSVEAANAAAALMAATDIAPDSGVALDQGYIDPGMDVAEPVTAFPYMGTQTYQYVDVMGEVEYVEAFNPQQALELPTDIAPDSGILNAETDPVPPSTEVIL